MTMMKDGEYVADLFESAGFEPRPYSGRGMNGKHCLGVDVTSLGTFLSAVLAVGDEEELRLFGKACLDMCTDAMGKGTIIYFPGLECPARFS